jgi:glycogen(starch) synthase
MPVVTNRSSVVYNAIDVPDLPPAALDMTEPRLLCLGRVVPVKGFDLAVAAMTEILRVHPGTRLLIAGDGPQRPELETQARSLGIDGVVEFPGWVLPARIPHLMNGATVAVIPSRQESFGLVALEAAMMGRPVVAARVGGLPEVVADGVTGRLVAPENVPALAEAVCSMLADPDLMIEMGRRARERAMRQFTWDRYLDAYERLYRRLLGADQTRST